jgi:hypothetical protein
MIPVGTMFSADRGIVFLKIKFVPHPAKNACE